MLQQVCGAKGVLAEEFLKGWEVSLFAITDGRDYQTTLFARITSSYMTMIMPQYRWDGSVLSSMGSRTLSQTDRTGYSGAGFICQ
jgi:hypothetical protein